MRRNEFDYLSQLELRASSRKPKSAMLIAHELILGVSWRTTVDERYIGFSRECLPTAMHHCEPRLIDAHHRRPDEQSLLECRRIVGRDLHTVILPVHEDIRPGLKLGVNPGMRIDEMRSGSAAGDDLRCKPRFAQRLDRCTQDLQRLLDRAATVGIGMNMLHMAVIGL